MLKVNIQPLDCLDKFIILNHWTDHVSLRHRICASLFMGYIYMVAWLGYYYLKKKLAS